MSIPREASAGCMSAKRFVGRWPALSPRKSTRSGAAELVNAKRQEAKIAAAVERMNFMGLKNHSFARASQLLGWNGPLARSVGLPARQSGAPAQSQGIDFFARSPCRQVAAKNGQVGRSTGKKVNPRFAVTSSLV